MDFFRCSGSERHTWVSADDAAKCCNGYRRAQRITHDARGARIEFYWQPVDAPPDSPPAPEPAAAEDTEVGLRPKGVSHLAFFRRLGGLADDSPKQRTVKAGLLTLRLVDRWVYRISTHGGPSFRELVLVRRAIDAVPDDRTRDVLLKLTEAIREFSAEEVASLPSLLFGYGLLLETFAEWTLATDVYETAIRYAVDPDDRRGLPIVYGRLAFCHRQLGQISDAARAYEDGRVLARAVGDTGAELRLRNGEGHLAMHRGNVSAAIAIFDAVMRDARAGG